jgi:hypothetical protein
MNCGTSTVGAKHFVAMTICLTNHLVSDAHEFLIAWLTRVAVPTDDDRAVAGFEPAVWSPCRPDRLRTAG